MKTILLLAYIVWAVCSGYRVLTGRLKWLDRQAPLNIIVKIILSLMLGCVIAAFGLMYLKYKNNTL